MATPERISNEVLAERIQGVREDVAELSAEQGRTRTRLHNLEGFAAAYLDMQNENRRQEARQYRRMEVRLQVLTVVLGLAAVIFPVVSLYLSGK